MDCQGRRWYYVVPRAARQSPARRAECEVCPCAALVLAAHVSRPRRPRPDAALSSHAAPPRHVHSARWAAHAGVEQQRGDRAVPQPAERQGGGSRAGQVGARPAGEALPPQSIALCCVPSVGSIASRTAGTVCGRGRSQPAARASCLPWRVDPCGLSALAGGSLRLYMSQGSTHHWRRSSGWLRPAATTHRASRARRRREAPSAAAAACCCRLRACMQAVRPCPHTCM